MSKTINEYYLTTLLAEQATKNEVLNDKVTYPDYNTESDLVYLSECGLNIELYNPDVQKVFDKWFTFFFSTILECEER